MDDLVFPQSAASPPWSTLEPCERQLLPTQQPQGSKIGLLRRGGGGVVEPLASNGKNFRTMSADRLPMRFRTQVDVSKELANKARSFLLEWRSGH